MFVINLTVCNLEFSHGHKFMKSIENVGVHTGEFITAGSGGGIIIFTGELLLFSNIGTTVDFAASNTAFPLAAFAFAISAAQLSNRRPMAIGEFRSQREAE
jgi:hypothetical protein